MSTMRSGVASESVSSRPSFSRTRRAIYERYRHPLQTRDDIPRNAWLSHNDVERFNAIRNAAP